MLSHLCFASRGSPVRSRAYCTYEEHPEVFEIRKDAAWAFVLFDSTCDQRREKPNVIDKEGGNAGGPYCLLKTPEYGVWMLDDGVSENFLERFQTLAARVGVALRAPKGSDPRDVWLHGLFHYLLANRSKLLICADKGKGGIILRVCEASATFCSRLERKALEQSEPDNGSESERLRTGNQAESSPAESGKSVGGAGFALGCATLPKAAISARAGVVHWLPSFAFSEICLARSVASLCFYLH